MIRLLELEVQCIGYKMSVVCFCAAQSCCCCYCCCCYSFVLQTILVRGRFVQQTTPTAMTSSGGLVVPPVDGSWNEPVLVALCTPHASLLDHSVLSSTTSTYSTSTYSSSTGTSPLRFQSVHHLDMSFIDLDPQSVPAPDVLEFVVVMVASIVHTTLQSVGLSVCSMQHMSRNSQQFDQLLPVDRCAYYNILFL